MPQYIEYSLKDDKFRVRGNAICDTAKKIRVLNIARIKNCSLADGEIRENEPSKSMNNRVPADEERRSITMEVTYDRNALERILIHFSHLEKETKKLDQKHYRVKVVYDASDDTEMLIRILSFGPMVKVVEPDDFIVKIRERLQKQRKIFQSNTPRRFCQ
ncbi:MAG: WYL domain-containing protein [Lachnospiraceae bacterium]|nr:WYL domain-containing protein [Robinsoniella sp.]MDY3766926.1 WYL domain-containing protein [Lachnospiraceae bacterium]